MIDDVRYSAIMRDAPPWAQFLSLLMAMELGPKALGAALDRFEGRQVDWRQEVRPGLKLHQVNGKTASQIVRQYGEDVLAKVNAIFKKNGMDPVTDDRTPAEPTPATQGDGQKSQQPGSAAAALAADPPPAPQADPNDPEVVPGYRVSQLAGLPVDELLKIDGISPARAKELAAMPAKPR